MSQNEEQLSKQPQPDQAEDQAFFPSPFSLSQYTGPKTDFDGVNYKDAYQGDKWKILVIATEERYVFLENENMFSTGNHPVEMLLPLHHMMEAGFEVEIATITGYPVKLELWAMPEQDEAVMQTYEQLKPKLKQPKALKEVITNELASDSDYLAVFIPGGHGALVGLPESKEVQQTLDWAHEQDKYMISICHGPAAFLSASLNRETNPFDGYAMCVFPDALDEGDNVDMGYLPGKLRWLLADALTKQGVNVLNDDMSGQTHQDRKLLTGDSPLASNALGKMAAEVLVKAVNE